MRVVMLAGEAEPFAKAGGLADVMGALPPQLEKLGASVTIILPRYRLIDLQKFGFQPLPSVVPAHVPLGEESVPFDVHASVLPHSGVRVFLIGNDRFFGGDGIYTDAATGLDYANQAERWIFFQRAALEFTRSFLGGADILHCHDHQTGLVPAYLRTFYRATPEFARVVTVFTIHNLGYQGIFPAETMLKTGFNLAEFFPGGPFEFFGKMNFMKTGVVYSDVVTTVSPTYAREIQESHEFGYGLEGVLRARHDPPVGILNGIDYEKWNPETDSLIHARFGTRNLVEGKRENKRALLSVFGLRRSQIDRPLLGMVSRLDVQKGFDLVIPVVDELLERGISFVLLGSGNEAIKARLRAIIDRHPGRANVRFGYYNDLSHLIEAGADIFLMPSKYEPCGLNQMYSMRYGTVPVVRATGGLADTVREFDPKTGTGTGFLFYKYEADDFKDAVVRALDLWTDQAAWRQLMVNGMTSDFSWARSAAQYMEVYEAALKRHHA